MVTRSTRSRVLGIALAILMLMPVVGGTLVPIAPHRGNQFLLSAPTIDSPADITFENGTLGKTIVWHPTSTNPKNYSITRDGVVHREAPWGGGDITVFLNHLYPEGFLDEPDEVPSTFVFICTVFDTAGDSVSDEVLVNVIPDETAPILIQQPANITYEEGSFGHYIKWNFTETNPDFYNVSMYSNEPTSNESVIESGDWDGTNFSINVDGLNASHWYIYTIFVNDTIGFNTTSLVNVTVVPDTTAPIIQSPGNMSIEFGAIGEAVSWHAFDSNPKNYTITVIIHYNNTMYGNLTKPLHAPANISVEDWTFSDPEGGAIQVSLDHVYLGNYTFTLLLLDDYGRNATDTVNVTIYEDVRAPIIHDLDDLTYEEGYTGYSLEWSVEETNPRSYNLTKDGEILLEGIWRGENISTSVDNLPVGDYSYNITFVDFFNFTSSQVVIVNVTPDAHLPLIQQVQAIQSYNTPTTNNLTVQAYAWDLNIIRNISIEWHSGNVDATQELNMTLQGNDFYFAPLGEFEHGVTVHFRITAIDNSSVHNVATTEWMQYTITSLRRDMFPLLLSVVIGILGALSMVAVLSLYFRTRTK